MPPSGRLSGGLGDPVRLLVAAGLHRRWELLRLSARVLAGDLESIAVVVLASDGPSNWHLTLGRAGLVTGERAIYRHQDMMPGRLHYGIRSCRRPGTFSSLAIATVGDRPPSRQRHPQLPR